MTPEAARFLAKAGRLLAEARLPMPRAGQAVAEAARLVAHVASSLGDPRQAHG